MVTVFSLAYSKAVFAVIVLQSLRKIIVDTAEFIPGTVHLEYTSIFGNVFGPSIFVLLASNTCYTHVTPCDMVHCRW